MRIDNFTRMLPQNLTKVHRPIVRRRIVDSKVYLCCAHSPRRSSKRAGDVFAAPSPPPYPHSGPHQSTTRPWGGAMPFLARA
jgi:hypothetical protein